MNKNNNSRFPFGESKAQLIDESEFVDESIVVPTPPILEKEKSFLKESIMKMAIDNRKELNKYSFTSKKSQRVYIYHNNGKKEYFSTEGINPLMIHELYIMNLKGTKYFYPAYRNKILNIFHSKENRYFENHKSIDYETAFKKLVDIVLDIKFMEM